MKTTVTAKFVYEKPDGSVSLRSLVDVTMPSEKYICGLDESRNLQFRKFRVDRISRWLQQPRVHSIRTRSKKYCESCGNYTGNTLIAQLKYPKLTESRKPKRLCKICYYNNESHLKRLTY